MRRQRDRMLFFTLGAAWCTLAACSQPAAVSGVEARLPEPTPDAATDSHRVDGVPEATPQDRSIGREGARPADAAYGTGRDAAQGAATRDASPDAPRATPVGDPPEAAPDAGDDAAGDARTGWTTEDTRCLDGITDYASAGPFQFETESHTGLEVGEHLDVWIPRVPPGCQVPVVHFAVTTGATFTSYLPSLERLASHGFLVLCSQSTAYIGTGTAAARAFETAFAKYPLLAAHRFGSTGHGAGGQEALIGLYRAQANWGDRALYTAFAMQPESGFGASAERPWSELYALVSSPVFMFSGEGTDGLVSQGWVQRAFDALSDTVEAYHWAEVGGTHIPVSNDDYQRLSIPWLRWKLLGDAQACRAFKAIRQDPRWVEADVQNERTCD